VKLVVSIAALLLSAAPATAADLCQTVTAAHSLQYLQDEKSGGIVAMIKPAAFPETVTAFVVKSDPSFQDQKFEIFPMGGGAGLAVHYEGSEAEQYNMMFDRVGGALKAVEIPNLNPEAGSYLNLYAATIGGVPALFLNNQKPGGTVTRIVSWQDHKWGAVCELKSPASK
jgi:hypothetical protein